MAKIIDIKTGTVIKSDSNLNSYGIAEEFLNENHFDTGMFDCLSDMVKTMTGDASTPFDTVGEMIEYIPDVVNCGEETAFMFVFHSHGLDYFVLGWDYEEDEDLWTKIIGKYYPDYAVKES